MKGTTWQRCTSCSRKVNGREARAKHKQSDCDGTNATWAYKVDLGTVSGKRKQQIRAGFETAAEADQARRDVLRKLDAGTWVEPSALTLGDYLVDEWLPTRRGRDAGGTYRKRERHAVRYVAPRIGGVGLQQLTAQHLDDLYATLQAEGAGRGPLSPSTVSDTHRTLHKALHDAMRWGKASRNVAKDADPPSLATVKAAARSEMHVWNGPQVATFLQATADSPHAPAFLLLAMTGARRSEALAVRWSDVDLDRGEVSIGRAAVHDADGQLQLRESTKTDRSSRTVSLDPGTVAGLRRHKATQAAQRLAAGSAWHDLDLVCSRADGTPWDPRATSMAFMRASKAAGLPRIRLHDLRHTHATLLLQSGTPVRTVCDRLGHANPSVTLNIYSHLMPGDDEGAAATFANLLGSPTGPAAVHESATR